MKKSVLYISVLVVGFPMFAMVSCENQGKDKQQTKDEKKMAEELNDEKFESRESENTADFLVDAVAANLAEIELADLAIAKSGNDEIRTLARKLKDDHTLILNDLRMFAEKRGVTVPSKMGKSDSSDVEKMRLEKPEDFDKRWLKDMEARHSSSLKKFRKCAEENEDEELQDLADKHLVTIESHHLRLKKMLEEY